MRVRLLTRAAQYFFTDSKAGADADERSWESQGSSRNKSLAASSALLLCVIAANVPFLNQAFHIDDGLYLLMAKNVSLSPWFPQDIPIYFEGLHGEDLASGEHPWPLTSYLMAFCAHLAGGFSEVSLHMGFLVFPIILAGSMFLLARRFTGHPFLTTLVFLTLPAVYLLSHTLMTDIPQLSFWVASVALFSRGVDSGRPSFVWFAAAAATLASLVSYSGLCLIPLLSFYAFLRKSRRAILPIAIMPAAVFGFWLVMNYSHYHRFTPGMMLGYYFLVRRVLSPGLLIQKSAYMVLALGGATVLPLSVIALTRKISIAAGLSLAAAAIWITGAVEWDLLQKTLFVVFFCAGAVAIIEVIRVTVCSARFSSGDAELAKDDFFLGVWCLGMLVFCALFYMTGSVRYLLPAMPPLILILARQVEWKVDERGFRWVAAANLAMGASLALLLAAADYQFARIYRDFASTLTRDYPSRRGNLWFTGEWGFRTYLERLGGRELGRRDPRPAPGDVLVIPRLASPYDTLFLKILNLESIMLVAPSRVSFDIPSVPPDAVLVYTIGMPFHNKSDGMDFSVRFLLPDEDRLLEHSRLLPAEGKRWRAHEIPLREIAGKVGKLVFSADVGDSGNADADWVALARARICGRSERGETTLYDFRQHLNDARIEPAPGVMYHTSQNLPVFPMTVWLEQEPATILRGRYDYRPALPIRLLDARAHAGFWSAGWGLLPYSLVSDGAPVESISVYEIVRKVEAYGEVMQSWYPEAKR